MVQNAADGVYVLSQQTANGLTPVAQFVSVGGQEYWWLYPGYQAPSLSGPVTLEYTYSGPVPQGFLQNPVPPIQPGPPTNSIPVNATDVAGSGPYNFLVPSASDDKPDPFQIIPMRQAGYLEVLLQT